MSEPYIKQRDGGYWIQDHAYRWIRLSIGGSKDSLPESIAECFQVLTLEQVYGAITYYLSHRLEIDAYLRAAEQDYEAFRQRLRAKYPCLSARLDPLIYSLP